MHLKPPGFTYSAWYDMIWHMAKRTESDKVLRDKAFRIASEKDMMVEVVLIPYQIINSQVHFMGSLLEVLREEKFINILETIFGMLI